MSAQLVAVLQVGDVVLQLGQLGLDLLAVELVRVDLRLVGFGQVLVVLVEVLELFGGYFGGGGWVVCGLWLFGLWLDWGLWVFLVGLEWLFLVFVFYGFRLCDFLLLLLFLVFLLCSLFGTVLGPISSLEPFPLPLDLQIANILLGQPLIVILLGLLHRVNILPEIPHSELIHLLKLLRHEHRLIQSRREAAAQDYRLVFLVDRGERVFQVGFGEAGGSWRFGSRGGCLGGSRAGFGRGGWAARFQGLSCELDRFYQFVELSVAQLVWGLGLEDLQIVVDLSLGYSEHITEFGIVSQIQLQLRLTDQFPLILQHLEHSFKQILLIDLSHLGLIHHIMEPPSLDLPLLPGHNPLISAPLLPLDLMIGHPLPLNNPLSLLQLLPHNLPLLRIQHGIGMHYLFGWRLERPEALQLFLPVVEGLQLLQPPPSLLDLQVEFDGR